MSRKKRRVWMLGTIVAIIGAAALAGNAMRSKTAASPPSSATRSTSMFMPIVENRTAPPGPAPEGIVWIPGGEFSMGAADPPGEHPTVFYLRRDRR